MELLVQPSGRSLHFERGSNLLDALRKSGVSVSHSCMAGRCGTCRCRIVRGSVRQLSIAPAAAVVEAGGYALACMSTLEDDCAIEIPEPDEIVTHPARAIKSTVVAIERLTRDVLRLRLRSAKAFSFSPGQYVNLQFTPEHARPFSMATPSGDTDMEFHVRLVPGGRVTQYIGAALKVGDTVRVGGPLGTAYLRRKHAGPMLCVAGGTGLAPVLSIIRGAAAAGMTNPIHVYFGAQSCEDIYGRQWLAELAASHDNIRVALVAGAARPGSGVRAGRVTDAVDGDLSDLTGWRAYLCGSPAMVEAAARLVVAKGVAAPHVHADAFYQAADSGVRAP